MSLRELYPFDGKPDPECWDCNGRGVCPDNEYDVCECIYHRQEAHELWLKDMEENIEKIILGKPKRVVY